MNKSDRNSNIELLRIIAMFFIVLGHYWVWSVTNMQMLDNAQIISISDKNQLVRQWYFLSRVSVDVFILISGYFLINSNFSFRRVLSIAKQSWFYSYLILFATIILDFRMLTIRRFLTALFPIMFQQNWFVSSYIGLLMLSPFLNKAFLMLCTKNRINLVFFLTLVCSLIPMLTLHFNEEVGFRYLGLFILLYFLGASIKVYALDKKLSTKILMGGTFLALILTYLSTVIINLVGVGRSKVISRIMYFSSQPSILLICSACFIFMFFLSVDLKKNRLINRISATTFGVYLIHENPLARYFFWDYLFRGSDTLKDTTSMFVVKSLIATLLVFCICSFLDIIRECIFRAIPEVNLKSKIDKYNGIVASVEHWLSTTKKGKDT